jgi:cytochrome b involved in lipid metabolism
MKKHPGGRWIILENSGKDASAPFLKQVHSEVAIEIMMNLYLGEIESTHP